MRITFAWWNTSLSPLGRRRATPDQRAVAGKVVKFLAVTARVDCLALGEVTAEDLHGLLGMDELVGYDL